MVALLVRQMLLLRCDPKMHTAEYVDTELWRRVLFRDVFRQSFQPTNELSNHGQADFVNWYRLHRHKPQHSSSQHPGRHPNRRERVVAQYAHGHATLERLHDATQPSTIGLGLQHMTVRCNEAQKLRACSCLVANSR